MQIERFLLTECKNNAENNIYSCDHRQEFHLHFFLSRQTVRIQTLCQQITTEIQYTTKWYVICRVFFTINWRVVFRFCSIESFIKIWCCIHTWKGWLIWIQYRSPFPIQTISVLNNYTDIAHVSTSPSHVPRYHKSILATTYNLGCQQFHRASLTWGKMSWRRQQIMIIKNNNMTDCKNHYVNERFYS